MREIKFRAWDTKLKVMGQVSRIHFYENSVISGIEIIYKNKYGSFYNYVTECTPIKVNDLILMQHIGLQDDNEKDIYEGDIAEISFVGMYGYTHNSVVTFEFSKYSLSFGINKDGIFTAFGDRNFQKINIIGNIHENPELLKENIT